MSLLREAERRIANRKANATLNAFITPLQRPEQWLDRAREADLRKSQGNTKSKIDGRFVSVKDNICTRGCPTTCASGILDKFTSPFSATVVEQLEDAGAIVTGKANLDEFGMGSNSINSHFGPVKNPRQDPNGQSLSAGGSSGGSAVSVATDQCYVALGTDTGGSVRLPAAYTGTVGFKPSYGLISRWGVIAYANSLDTVGILGRNTSSIFDVFDILNKHDPRDPTSLSPLSRSRVIFSLDRGSRLASRSTTSPLRIGVPIEYNISELSPSVRRAWILSLAHLREQGHIIHPVSLPATKHALSAYYVLAPAEASSNLAKYDGVRYGTRSEGPDSGRQPDGYLYAKARGKFGREVKRRILLGTFSLSADAIDNYFIQAQRVRRVVQHEFNSVFRMEHPLVPITGLEDVGRNPKHVCVDVLVCPTSPSSPPRLSSLTDVNDDVSSSLDAYVNDVFTVPASLAGLPAVSVPVSVSSGGQDQNQSDPVGIQIVGQYGDDDLVLKTGELLEGKVLK